ncbi:MAG: SdrD B-like domain-containing protein, partial [Myxococcota bacterium]
TEECANPGCDGAGTCSATHIAEPDSTPCGDTGLECWNPGCEAGVCEQAHAPVEASTPCSETPDTEECANPGCDGAGTCSATHIAEPDSTPCGDTGLECWNPGCEAGVCEQAHTPEPASTPCSETPDTEECANPGCDGAGTCSPTHIAEPDSTACTDDDGNPCSIAGCEAGVCEQVHTCEPDGKADCEITIGDLVWNDANADGLQPTESGIADVDLNLIECSAGDVLEAMTTTNGSGNYEFTVTAVTNLETCLPESRQLLVEVDGSNFAGGGPLEGFNGSPQDVGADDTVDSDCDPATDRTMCTAFPPGTDLTVDCGFFPPEGGCLTRTPGFWCTHPTVTDLFLPLTSCGVDLTNVLVATAGSALEDLNFNGKDFKPAATSPQQLQLVRQCAAAALNFAASEANEGSCESEPLSSGETIGEVFDSCCADLCNSGASKQEIGGSGCIGLLDEFNNSQDTLGVCVAGVCEGTATACSSDEDCAPEPFDALGSSMCPVPDGASPILTDTCGGQPDRCSEAAGNGFVNPGRALGPK